MQRWGGIKETREASSEFDSVIALTSETVTRGVSFLPQRRLPRAALSSISQSVSCQFNIQLYAVYRTQLGYIHQGIQNSLVSLLVLFETRFTNFNVDALKCSASIHNNGYICAT